MICPRLSTTSILAAAIVLFSALGIEAAPSESYLYFVYYEDDEFSFSGSQCRRNPVGIEGYASGDEASVTGGAGDNCAEEIACQIDVNSGACQNDLARTVSGSVVTVITDDGQIQECDSTNFEIGLPECLFFDGCEESSAYPHCHFDIVKTSDLQRNPEMLRNDDPGDLEDYAYLVYYSDSSCTDIAGVKGAVSDTTFEIPRLDSDVSCDDAMACVLQPDGSTCQTIRSLTKDLGVSKLRAQTRGDQVFECDSSNEQVGEDTCAVLDPQPCRPSSTIANCHFRWLSAQDLAQRPRRLVGDFRNTDPFVTNAGYSLGANAMAYLFVVMTTVVVIFVGM